MVEKTNSFGTVVFTRRCDQGEKSPDCESRYGDTTVERRIKLSLGTVVSASGATRDRSLLIVNPGTGTDLRKTVRAWHRGYTLRCTQGMKTVSIKISPCPIYTGSDR